MNLRIVSSIWALFVLSPIVVAQYVPPPELSRDAVQGTYLNHLPTIYEMYSWNADTKEVSFLVFWRPNPTVPWKEPVEHIETVSYYITAIAPIYGIDWNSLYVIGTNIDGKTIIEKWKVIITGFPDGALKVTVQKDQVVTSPTLTHIRAAAASPNDQFLIVQRHETKEILKLSLPSGSTSVLLTPTSYPNLQYYDCIQWQKHTTAGDAFRILQGRNGDRIDHPGSILVWDADLDGTPNLVEELTPDQYRNRGYLDGGVWEPLRTLYVFD